MVAVSPMPSTAPRAQIEQVTPKIAKALLERNEVNRHLRPGHVDALARDMANGDWRVTGEAIKFSADGKLLDGQHRLEAIVKCGVAVPLFVVYGLDAETQAQMDAGRKRTAADVLQMQDGEADAVMLAATARFALSYERSGQARTANLAYTTQEIRDYIAEHPDIRRAVAIARSMQGSIDAKPVVVSFAFYTLAGIDEAHALDFFHRWHSMQNLREHDPVLALIQKLAIARRQREKLTHRDELSLIFRAWNASRKHRPMRILKLRGNAGEVAVPKPV